MQPNQFECPDFVQLPVDGDPNKKKWVMIVNINPGCLFGGSATEYFVGDFDGTTFVCDNKPETTKWLDFGKDHYATVCFSNTGDRVVAVPWMSNWQYANLTPTKQFRGINALPRELSLYTQNGEIYMAANAAKEVQALRKEPRDLGSFEVEKEQITDNLLADNKGAYELEMDITPGNASKVGIELSNAKGEHTTIYLDLKSGRAVMDRTESGITDFGKKAVPHEKETHDHRKTNSINYKDDFALATWAPLSLCAGKTYHLNVFVDKCSVELFVDGGRIAMTNLVFPTEVYNTLKCFAEGGKAAFGQVKAYRLSL